MDSLACFFTNFDIILSLIWCYLGLDYKKKFSTFSTIVDVTI